MFYIYILYASKLNKFYVGQTANLERRLFFHNRGKSKFTSTGIPWTLIWVATKTSRKDALILERKLKNLTRKRKVRPMRKYKAGLINPTILNQLFPINDEI
ncbi:MAG: GIY-YIG nuclease family protein [Bacteroidota bacterium]